MKNKLVRAGALAASAVVLSMSIPSVAEAADKSYSYVYDYWEDVQDCPDPYTVCKVFTSADLGLEVNLKNPRGMFAIDNMLYVCDTGNNRIVVLERTGKEELVVRRIITEFAGDVPVTTFNGPTDIAVSPEGDLYIADKGNARILKLDKNLNYLLQFDKPVDSTLKEDATFAPDKVVIDTAGRVYCIATGINKGLIKYEMDGTFSGFVGATKVTYDFTDYIWKKFASQEARALMADFVPTEYSNLFMDPEGFIYACSNAFSEEDLDSESAQAIRKLNLLGNDILVKNGNIPNYGDIYWGAGGGYSGPSQFTDVTVFENDVYVCLDKNRGRLFGYDDQGRMMFAFGGNGNMDGYFRLPVAIDHMGYDMMVLDSLDCSITMFVPTTFGSLVYQAMDQFDQGKYDESGESWRQVMDLDGNYELAYIGIGRSLLRSKDYKEAMEYFELKYDDENYSKAFEQYRKIWVEEHIAIIVFVILLVFLVPMAIGKLRAIVYEIDTADIFKL